MMFGELYFDGVNDTTDRGPFAIICSHGVDGNIADVYGNSAEEAERAARHIITVVNYVDGHIRDELQWFSQLMEEKLLANDYKGGWDECSLLWLLAKLDEETGELAERVMQLYTTDGHSLVEITTMPN